MARTTTKSNPKKADDKGVSGDDSVGKMIPIESLKLPKKQPRRSFDPEKLEQLRESVRKHGILEPLIVRPAPRNTYELVAGERRYQAAKAENLPTVPVIIRDLGDQEASELALMENLQRDDLNPIDETEGVLDLLCQRLEIDQNALISLLNLAANAERRGQPLTDNVIRQIEVVDELLRTIGRLTRESFRSNRLPLLSLPEDILEYLRGGKLEYTKAKVIAKLEEDDRKALAEETIKEGLSLREVRQRVKELMPESRGAARNLRSSFKALVNIKSDAWTDEKKRAKIQALLHELEGLLEREE
ncbi:ParB/RepB/Spo0J family partition protein [soil metagenome]